MFIIYTDTVKLMEVVWVSFGEWRGYWFTALGVHTLAGYLEQNFRYKISQAIWYYDNNDIENFLSYLLINKPKYICLSVNIGHVEHVIALVKKINNLYVDNDFLFPRFIFGNRGVFDSDSIEKIFLYIPKALVVVGDGEDAIINLLYGDSFEKIPNLYYKKDGQIFFSFIKSFDVNNYISPSYKIPIINKSYLALNKNVAYVEVSRGCSSKPACSFCSNSLTHNTHWRMLSLSQVIKNTCAVANEKPKAINFVSEDFLGNNDVGINLFLNKIKELRLQKIIDAKIGFYCAIKVSDVYSEKNSNCNNLKIDKLRLMKELGFNALYLGFESGSNAQLQRYKKGITREESLKAIQILRELNFYIDGGFIPFDPLVTVEDCIQNISFLKEARVPKLLLFPFNRLIAFSGTAYYSMYKKINCIDKRSFLLLQVVEYIDRFIPYDLFELFLQSLRLCYFSNTDHLRIQKYETIINNYGDIALSFLEELMFTLSKNNADLLSIELANEFLEKQKSFSEDLSLLLQTEHPDLFIINAVPEIPEIRKALSF